MKAIGKLKIADAEAKLVSLLKNDQSENVRVAAILALSNANPESISGPIEIAMKDNSRAVRVVGLDLLTKTDISQELMVNLLQDVIQNRTTAEKQSALLSLGNLENSAELPLWNTLLDDLSKNKLPNEVMIELEEAIDATGSADLRTKYDKIQAEKTGEIW